MDDPSASDPGLRPRAVLASGAGRYADPWHPFAETSARVASVLREAGWEVDLVDDPAIALTRLDGARLLVVNAGDPWGEDGADRLVEPDAAAGLAAALARGIGVLAIHSALSTLRDHPSWRAAIGGSWQQGRSWHPEIGEASVRIVDRGHAITEGIGDFTLFDERYTALEVDSDVRVLAAHDLDGVAHPLVWVRERPARAVVCALGHEPRAYDSPELRTLVARAARWAGRPEPGRLGA
ncbi:ThuA domain-containing protein [Microbacterium sulfonylureivorans]|uniref:ThuA domain-containing protein n=1 Tax=Microbacterium sulfonylureivorans TaxID=2486854 RepID=UPI001F0C0C23|nr:ThuA domain-containing protein [Microbacterium sulfonylureivorans]